MKKFYLRKDGESQGPFSLEELAQKKVTGDTMIWYEGLDQWSKARSIAELKVILNHVPPPFPNIEDGSEENINYSKSSVPSKGHAVGKIFEAIFSFIFSVGRSMALLILIIFAIGIAVMYFTKNGRSSPFKVAVNPPRPRVVESHGNEDPSSTVFHFHEAVYATVLNEGGSGKIIVKAKLSQDGNTFERSEDAVIGENQTKDFHFNFTEPARAGGNMTYEVTAIAL